MRRSWVQAAIVLTGLAATSAYAQRPQIQWDESYDFEAVKTFQWHYTPETSLVEREPFLHSRIKNAIEHELAGWLTEVESNPDVYVTYHTSSESKVRVSADTWGYGFGSYGRDPWGYHGYGRYGPPARTTTRVTEYDVGTLVVDIWDAASKQLVWRGTVSRTVSSNIDKVQRDVLKAIQQMAKRGRKLWEKANR